MKRISIREKLRSQIWCKNASLWHDSRLLQRSSLAFNVAIDISPSSNNERRRYLLCQRLVEEAWVNS
jgi:hypothetical protein